MLVVRGHARQVIIREQEKCRIPTMDMITMNKGLFLVCLMVEMLSNEIRTLTESTPILADGLEL